MPKSYFNWSSGKDSALALYRVLQSPNWEIGCLLTTFSQAFDRVTMHGLRRALWQAQIDALGLPAQTVELPKQPSMELYAEKMQAALAPLKAAGYTHSIFGDIFLEDLRAYREKQLAALDMHCYFPLWKEATKTLLQEFIDLGFQAIVIAVDGQKLPADFTGRLINQGFLNDLPDTVDSCGENGEFHTFCFDGPIFQQPVPFRLGERVARQYPNPTEKGELTFYFQDLLPLD